MKLKRTRNQSKKYSRLNNGGYNIFYGSETRTCSFRHHAIGVTEPSAFLHSRDVSLVCDKADVGRVFASTTAVYGTELFLFVPTAGHTH
jgi:hypothetical protein